MALCAAVTTLSTATINSCVSKYYSDLANEESARRADVKQLEDLIKSGDKLTKILVAEVKSGKLNSESKKAISDNLVDQYEFLNTIRGTTGLAGGMSSIDRYQRQLVKTNRSLRGVDNVTTFMNFAQQVSESVDLRLQTLRELRQAAGMWTDQPRPDALQQDNEFGQS